MNRMSKTDRLFSGRQLSRLIWPLVAEQVLSVLVGMVDVLMVSFVGEAAVSGVSLVDAVNHLVLQVLFAMTAGGTVVCAKYIGAGEYTSARKSGGQLLSVTTGALLLLSLFLLAGGQSLLRLLFGTVEPEVMRDAEIYMRFTAVSFPFLAVYHSAASIFRAEGNTRLSMLVSFGMNLLNIAGDALCIFGFGMGVEGVAIATLLARAVAAVAICLFLQSPLGEFVGDMLKLQLLVLQLQVFALVLGSCCFEGMRLVEGDISRLSGVEGVGIFLVSHLQVIGIFPSPQLGISV